MIQDIDKKVQIFYTTTPFPDYRLDRFNTKDDLIVAASPFSKTLDYSIPAEASVIDVGTGTGQLSAFLSLRRSCVWGIDFSDGSLNKAQLLKQKLGLDSWHLKKVDILDPVAIEKIGRQFDYVLCLGVLHHTKDAYQGFRNILKLLKPGGYVAVGLYNTFGRIPQKIRIALAKTFFNNNESIKDYFIRMQIGDLKDEERRRGWWNDQYLHPHETCHTLGQVLRWFKQNRVDYYQMVPSARFFDRSSVSISGVWNNYQERYPSWPEQFLKQVGWIWKTHHEGGYWITFGRKSVE